MILSFERVPKILCGFSTIIWYIVFDTFIMTNIFVVKAKEKNLISSLYWSSTTNTNNSGNAWNVNFNNGNTNNNNKTNSNYVRCVRAG